MKPSVFFQDYSLLFILFAIRHYSLVAIRHYSLFAIRDYSLFAIRVFQTPLEEQAAVTAVACFLQADYSYQSNWCHYSQIAANTIKQLAKLQWLLPCFHTAA